jgi:hypothetical protein
MPKYGVIREDGTYTVKGVPVGNAKVVVTSPDPKPAAKTRPGPEGRPDPRGEDPGPTLPEAAAKGWFPLPGKYGDLATTTLRVEVKRGSTPHDVVLE